MIALKALTSLYKRFKGITLGYPTGEQEDLVKRLIGRSMKTTQTGLGGYRVDAPIDDPENLSNELDRSRIIVENESKLKDKDEVYRQALLVLLKSVEIKTTKIDKLIEELEEME